MMPMILIDIHTTYMINFLWLLINGIKHMKNVMIFHALVRHAVSVKQTYQKESIRHIILPACDM